MKKKNDKVTHEWTALCQASSIDTESNAISLFGIVETVKIDLKIDESKAAEKKEKGWYAVPFNLQLVSRLLKSEINSDIPFNLQYRIKDPSKKNIGKKFGSTVKFSKGLDSLRVKNLIGNFPVTDSGYYFIEVYIGNVVENYKKVGQTRIKIDLNFS